MREIKCRVWTGTQYIYTRGDIDYFDNDGIEHMAQQVVFKDAWENVCIYDCTTNGTKTIKIIKDGIIEQYTPIKNICQGDIVYIAGLGNCTIIFDGLTFEAVTPKGDIVELRGCLEDIESVVGNIHEELQK